MSFLRDRSSGPLYSSNGGGGLLDHGPFDFPMDSLRPAGSLSAASLTRGGGGVYGGGGGASLDDRRYLANLSGALLPIGAGAPRLNDTGLRRLHQLYQARLESLCVRARSVHRPPYDDDDTIHMITRMLNLELRAHPTLNPPHPLMTPQHHPPCPPPPPSSARRYTRFAQTAASIAQDITVQVLGRDTQSADFVADRIAEIVRACIYDEKELTISQLSAQLAANASQLNVADSERSFLRSNMEGQLASTSAALREGIATSQRQAWAARQADAAQREALRAEAVAYAERSDARGRELVEARRRAEAAEEAAARCVRLLSSACRHTHCSAKTNERDAKLK
jgi:hypothetical protein